MSGLEGIPASGPLAIIANMTAVAGTEKTYLTAYPADDRFVPNASDLNVNAGTVLPNLIVVGLATTGHPRYAGFFNAQGTINMVVDVDGWFQ